LDEPAQLPATAGLASGVPKRLVTGPLADEEDNRIP